MLFNGLVLAKGLSHFYLVLIEKYGKIYGDLTFAFGVELKQSSLTEKC